MIGHSAASSGIRPPPPAFRQVMRRFLLTTTPRAQALVVATNQRCTKRDSRSHYFRFFTQPPKLEKETLVSYPKDFPRCYKPWLSGRIGAVERSVCHALMLRGPCLGVAGGGFVVHLRTRAGTPVTEAERAENMRRADVARQATIAECQHLYTMLGDRTLTPMQIEAVRVSMNTRRCSTSGWRPQS